MISLGPSASKQYDPLEELDALDAPKQSSKSAVETKKTSEKPVDKKNSNAGGSWFGGLFSKLALKPKNQMILPDDSNPAVRVNFCKKYLGESRITLGFMFYVAKGSRGFLW